MSESEYSDRLRFMSNVNRRELQRLENKLNAAFRTIQKEGEISADGFRNLLETAGRGSPENPQRAYLNVISEDGVKAKGLGAAFDWAKAGQPVNEDDALPILSHLKEQVVRASFAADNPDDVTEDYVGKPYGENGKSLFPYNLPKPTL